MAYGKRRRRLGGLIKHIANVEDTWNRFIAETAQHAGHADIIRESIDGTKTMG